MKCVFLLAVLTAFAVPLLAQDIHCTQIAIASSASEASVGIRHRCPRCDREQCVHLEKIQGFPDPLCRFGAVSLSVGSCGLRMSRESISFNVTLSVPDVIPNPMPASTSKNLLE